MLFCRNLGCQPITLCASSILPMNRKRNYWGNIPNMYINKLEERHETVPELQQQLLTINDIEVLMGYSLNYTDVCNLKIKERLALLSNGWCIPIVQSILKPLGDIFEALPSRGY